MALDLTQDALSLATSVIEPFTFIGGLRSPVLQHCTTARIG